MTNEVDLSSKKIYNSEKIYLIGDVKNMKNILENDIEKELDNIYGIENSKWEILNYAKYLEISNKIHFANYNIIIHNNSDYPSETKNKLVEFLYKLLKNNKIIEKGYEFITIDDIGKKTEKVKTRIGFAV